MGAKVGRLGGTGYHQQKKNVMPSVAEASRVQQ
jgi:hypothetical protein